MNDIPSRSPGARPDSTPTEEIIAAAVAGAHVPGVVAAAGRGPDTLATWVAGQADSTPGRSRAMTAGTVFDLASLTKMVATTTATLALHRPASAVSHSGFTGTSLALDSPSGAWVILLTNAVHFGRDNTAIKALRRDLHGAVAADLFGDVPA